MRFQAHIVRRMLLAVAVFIDGMFAYSRFLEMQISGHQRMLSALAAIVPGIWLVWAIATVIASLDEMQRRIQIEAIEKICEPADSDLE